MYTGAVTDPWPLRHLVLRTPRLELRPDDDAGTTGSLTDVATDPTALLSGLLAEVDLPG